MQFVILVLWMSYSSVFTILSTGRVTERQRFALEWISYHASAKILMIELCVYLRFGQKFKKAA